MVTGFDAKTVDLLESGGIRPMEEAGEIIPGIENKCLTFADLVL